MQAERGRAWVPWLVTVLVVLLAGGVLYLAHRGSQQAQAQAVDEPADHDHAEHQQQTVQREGAQAREHVAAAEHQRNQRGTDQTEQQ